MFLRNKIGETQGEKLGQLMLLLIRSFNYSSNYLYSIRAILYGEMDIRRVSRKISIVESILLRLTPGGSSWKTYGNSRWVSGRISLLESILLGVTPGGSFGKTSANLLEIENNWICGGCLRTWFINTGKVIDSLMGN